MPAFNPGLVPLLELARQLDNVAEQIGNGVLAYHHFSEVAYVRHELRAGAEHLIRVLESTRSDGDVGDAARG